MEPRLPDYWRLKIAAFLHDPPQKPFALGRGHAAIGAALVKLLIDEDGARFHDTIVRADHLASGADRASFLKDVRTNFRTDPEIRHPLSGELIRVGELTHLRDLDDVAIDEAVERAVRQVRAHARPDDPRALFLALWRLLPDLLRAEHQEFGALWDLLPADTRMPDHGVLGHLALTSALAGCLSLEPEQGEPALLLVTFGPVQPFIEASRRTRDLVAASWILAEVTAAATRPIVEQLGPDHVLFPLLRGEPRIDDWLRTGLGVGLRGDSRPDVPTLPNRLLCVVPSKAVPGIAEACTTAARECWVEIVRSTATRLHQQLRGEAAELAAEVRVQLHAAAEPASAHLEAAWASWVWGSSNVVQAGAPATEALSELFGGDLGPLREWLAAGHEEAEKHAGYRVNAGALYGSSYAAVAGLLDHRKATRDFAPVTEGGLKCSLCGTREVLTSAEGSGFDQSKEWWSRIAEASGQRAVRPGEALCPTCLTKRFWQLPTGREAHPSVSDIAVADFKLEVLRRWDQLAPAATAWAEIVARKIGDSSGWLLPAVLHACDGDDSRKLFAQADGEWLLASARESTEIPAEALHQTVVRARDLIRQARDKGVRPPRPYLAVVHMDGDQMGKWLSGQLAPAFGDCLSREARAHFEAGGDTVRSMLARERLLAPATHATLSAALSAFARRSIKTAESQPDMPVHLVYAGGDDVLALLPARLALPFAERVRLLFSGHVGTPEDADTSRIRRDIRVDELGWDRGKGFARDRRGLYLAMGRKATMSAGIAVFHHRAPLSRALAEARAAEHHAKHDLGRDAFAFSIQRRSGSRSVVGAKWLRGSRSARDAIQRVGESIRSGELSPRFYSELAKVVARLAPPSEIDRAPETRLDLPPGILTSDLRKIVSDHLRPEVRADEAKRKEIQAAVRDVFALASSGSNARSDGEPREEPATLRELRRALDLLDAAVFLVREGDGD